MEAIEFKGDLQGHPEVFYHFCPYTTPQQKAWFAQKVIENRFYFSSPSEFNDPFDPWFRFAIPDRKKLLEYHANKFGATLAAQSRNDRRVAKRKIRNFDPDQTALSLTQKYRSEIQNEYRVACFIATREPILLWSHYAAKHTGVCIHFRHRIIPFATASKVRYTRVAPVIDVPLVGDWKEQFTRMLATKSPCWRYEHEYRMVRFPAYVDHPSRDLGTIWDDPYMHFPAEAICGITLGARMKSEDVVEIRRLVGSKIPIDRAYQSDDAFRLEFR